MKNVFEKIGLASFLLFALHFNPVGAQSLENTDGADVFNAQFAGGDEQMSLFFTENLNYPDHAAVRHIEGTVMVAFTVDTAGGIRNPKIRKSLGNGCDEEALRLVQSMPTWEPALLNGRPIASGKTVHIRFRLPY